MKKTLVIISACASLGLLAGCTDVKFESSSSGAGTQGADVRQGDESPDALADVVDDNKTPEEQERDLDRYVRDCRRPPTPSEREEYEREHNDERERAREDSGRAASQMRKDAKYHNKCVVICHLPPGNPANAHELTVPASAARAHLEHHQRLGENKSLVGDYLGPCRKP